MEKNNDKVNSRKGNKKITLLLVLKALELMSAKDNPIKQIHLAKMVNDIGGLLNLGIWCDRKTVGRHLKILVAAGYSIVIVRGKGCYLESNKFSKEESAILQELVSESKIPDMQKEQILSKINAQQNIIKKSELSKVCE